jgi:hypothetical protein
MCRVFPHKKHLQYTFLSQIKGTSSVCRHHLQTPPPFQPGDNMSEEVEDTRPVPLMQQLLDNPFLLLFLGVLIPMVVYTLWGVIDILTIPLAK